MQFLHLTFRHCHLYIMSRVARSLCGYQVLYHWLFIFCSLIDTPSLSLIAFSIFLPYTLNAYGYVTDACLETFKIITYLKCFNHEGVCVRCRCLDPLLCRPMTGKMNINPVNRLALYAKCADLSCSSTGLTYQWTLYRLGLNGAWLPIKNCEYYTTGPSSVITESTMNKLAFEIVDSSPVSTTRVDGPS